MKGQKINNKGITLIALVVTIVVLLILAGISISMLTGENGIITQAQNSKEQNEIGKEKEYINLAFSAVKAGKIARGDMSDVTSAELQEEINNYTNEATVTGTGILKITYTSGREYEVDGNGNILSKESYDGMYSVGGLEGQIAPEDLFEYEIIDEQAQTAKILRIKPEYCNIGGYSCTTDAYDVTDTNGDIIYKGEKISEKLVIPYEVMINGTKYTIKEVDLFVVEKYIACGTYLINYMNIPNIKWIIYPNTVESIQLTLPEQDERVHWRWYEGNTILEKVTFPNNLKFIGRDLFRETPWKNNLQEGELYIGNIYVGYIGNMPSNTTITIKEGTTLIAGSAFSGCTNLTEITIPESVTYIGEYSFDGCTNLTEITIPNSVTSIGEYTFCGCSSLTSITIPSSVTSIGTSAFSGCTNLTEITIPSSVTSIGDNAFDGCTYLQSIKIKKAENTISGAPWGANSATVNWNYKDE